MPDTTPEAKPATAPEGKPAGPARAPRHWARLLPREHGAWVQLLLPAVTALASGSRGAAPWLWTLASLAAFLAHEPLRVAVGHRGARLARDWAASARRVFAVALGLAAACAFVAWALRPIAAQWLLPPLATAVVLAAIVARRADRTLVGELVAAAILPWAALPTAVAGGVAPRLALGHAAVWSVGFALLTLAVRATKARALKQPDSRFLARVATVAGVGTVLAAAGLAFTAAATLAEAIGAALLAVVAVAMAWPRVPMRAFWRLGAALSVVAVATSAVLVFGAIR